VEGFAEHFLCRFSLANVEQSTSLQHHFNITSTSLQHQELQPAMNGASLLATGTTTNQLIWIADDTSIS
jgi:hypothetical protein